MENAKKKLTVKNKRGVKAGIITGSSLLIECLSEAILYNQGVALNLS